MRELEGERKGERRKVKESEYPLSGSHNPLSQFLSGSLFFLFLSFNPLLGSNWLGYVSGGNLSVSI